MINRWYVPVSCVDLYRGTFFYHDNQLTNHPSKTIGQIFLPNTFQFCPPSSAHLTLITEKYLRSTNPSSHKTISLLYITRLYIDDSIDNRAKAIGEV